jgi:putative colanic acid biosynthesis acetyltransferase WcaF
VNILNNKFTMSRVGQAIFNGFVTKFPSRPFASLKPRFLRLSGASVGLRCRVGDHVRILGPASLRLGDDTAIARDCVLDARGGLSLDNGALVGFESVILTATHNWATMDLPVHHQPAAKAPVRIGANTWLGARCIILPGVTIGDRAVVGAASVVTKDVAPESIVAGVPARYLAQRENV